MAKIDLNEPDRPSAAWNCDPAFAVLLKRFADDTLVEHDGTVYGLRPDLTLACFNPAWFRFAGDNDGEPEISRSWTLNTSILGALGPLQGFYVTAYRNCLSTGETWTHIYECSSPTLFRKFQMRAYPVGNREGLLVANSLVVEHPHHPEGVDIPADGFNAYRDFNGIAHMCSHCRRYRYERNPKRWDWLPAHVAELPDNVSHGLCPVCADYYFPLGKHAEGADS